MPTTDEITNFYYTPSAGANYISIDSGSQLAINGTAIWGTNGTIGFSTEVTTKKDGIHPVLYFKYIKSKFKYLEKIKLDSRLKRLEKAFYQAMENGQNALGEKIINILARETRESAIYAKGIRHFIERDDLTKHKRNIKGGHISDTLLKDFTRVIPKNVLAKKEKVKDVFDDFVIYHYWNEEAEKKIEKKQEITPDEKAKLRDPVLFGIIKETNRLYFIADWEDEFCDLTFSEIIDAIGKDDDEITLSVNPTFETNEKK